MDLDFSEDAKRLQDEVRRFLKARCTSSVVRAAMGGSPNAALWKEIADMGLTGASIPESLGGSGAGYLELCLVAEELGRTLAPVPFSSSVYLASELLLRAGSESQKATYLPHLAAGGLIGCLALMEGAGNPSIDGIHASVSRGVLSGTKVPVLDGLAADLAVVAARDGSGRTSGRVSLYLADLRDPSVKREVVDTIDPSLLGRAGRGWEILGDALDRAAILVAFEQLGGADRALEMAREYALERVAFGRPIGSFQAIKHMLADMYVAVTLARSNCYFAAYTLANDTPELGEAAAAARVSATQAYQQCSRNNIQVHGGMGFTWESDCHLYYRRSNLLALSLGSLAFWKDRLIERLRMRAAA